MKNMRRSVGGFLVAAIAAATITLTPAPADASGLASFCSYLSDGIARLEAQPESRLRNFLLAQARAVFDRYCR